MIDFKKPRVAIYYHVLPSTNFRNDGPPLFSLASMRRILNGVKDGQELFKDMSNDQGNVMHLWPGLEMDKFGKFDLNLLCDYGEDALRIPLDWELPHPSAYWVSDAHISLESYKYRLQRAKQFDHVFCCQKKFMEGFSADGIPMEKLFYLPHAVEPTCYRPVPIIEKWDWCFIGHLNNDFRIDLVDRFCKEWPVGEKGYLGWRMPEVPGHNVLENAAKKFCQSRIVLNENIKEDVNCRTFEALACRRALLTEQIPPLGELFQDKTHLRTFGTINEAVEIARELLADPEQRTYLAKNGYEEVMARHTYKHRMLELLKITTGFVPEEEKNVLAANCQ